MAQSMLSSAGVGDRTTTSHRPLLLDMQCNCYDEPRTTAICETHGERKIVTAGSEFDFPAVPP